MGIFLPFQRPTLGMSFQSTALRLVAIQRRPFCLPRIRHSDEREISAGAFPSSSTAPNLKDVEAVAGVAKEMLGSGKERTVAVSLPDDVAMTVSLRFDSLPSNEAERVALIRWRIHQETQCPQGPSQLVYRVFPQGASTCVLVAVVDQAILDQYVEMFAFLDLLPVSMSVESLALFDWFRPAMHSEGDVFFAHRSRSLLRVIAVHQGCPVYVRTKSLQSGEVNLLEELIGTIQYCHEYVGAASVSVASRSQLYFIDTRGGSLADGVFGTVRTRFVVPALTTNQEVELIPLGWEAASVQVLKDLDPCYLPALASVGVM